MDGKTLKLLPCNILDSGFWILNSEFWILCDSTKLNRTPAEKFKIFSWAAEGYHAMIEN
jgi:hypothetical protein